MWSAWYLLINDIIKSDFVVVTCITREVDGDIDRCTVIGISDQTEITCTWGWGVYFTNAHYEQIWSKNLSNIFD